MKIRRKMSCEATRLHTAVSTKLSQIHTSQSYSLDTYRGYSSLDGNGCFCPSLGPHKLVGELMGLRACSCGYDCRIVFRIEVDESTELEVILLLDIGTHDEVY